MKSVSSPGLKPRSVPGYDLTQCLSDSTRATVFRATRVADGCPVILKLLKPDQPTANEFARFEREYETTSTLRGSGIVGCYGLERYRQTAVLVLEDFGGISLNRWLQSRDDRPVGMPVPEFLELALQIARALNQVHAGGVIHRDINPSNLVINPNRRVLKVIDFGLASHWRKASPLSEEVPTMRGTLPYLSPEQTGRTRRPVDHRADLYSLGVTFYEMLTGRRPFEDEDPLALVHAHLARLARPPVELKPEIPETLSQIVMKLLAKAPQQRYQSVLGLEADLGRCLSWVRATEGVVHPPPLHFGLGESDERCLLEIPDRLYGRSEPISALRGALEEARRGPRRLVLVAGRSGVGKSALVAELRDPTLRQGGYFLNGKFDQYGGSSPYSALTQAFERWVDQILTEPESRLSWWRKTIGGALGPNVAAITEVVPSLERVVGEHPPLPRLSPHEHLNRFTHAFSTFVRAIGAAHCPLVLFVDDLQWADGASLEVLGRLIADDSIRHWLFIAAYRDNELESDHPLSASLRRLDANGMPSLRLVLSDLSREDIEQFVRDSLGCPLHDAQELGHLVFAKTQGNAFFAHQLLCSLYDEGALAYSLQEHRWTWDAANITNQASAANVVNMVAARVNKLPPPTSRLLRLAACLGNEFEVETLAAVEGASLQTMLADLAPAVTQGLVVVRERSLSYDDRASALCSFLHDGVQHACYGELDEATRRRTHLAIARALRANPMPHAKERVVFAVVQHYGKAGDLVSDEVEKALLAGLCLEAADLATGAAAFHSARDYLEQALSLMPADGWSSRYEMMLRIHSQMATCLSLTGDSGRLEQICQVTESNAHGEVDKARIKLARMMELIGQGNLTAAVGYGFEYIAQLGVHLPLEPSPEEASQYFIDTARWLTEDRIRALPTLPDAPAEVAIILETSIMLNGPVYGANLHLSMLFVARIARLCVERGLSQWAPVSLTTFALLLCAVAHDIDKARQLTEVTLGLYEKRFCADCVIASMSTAIGGFILHRYEHLRNTLPVLARGAEKGLASGSFDFVPYCLWFRCSHELFLGGPLEQVEADARAAIETCRLVHATHLRRWCSVVLQACLNLENKAQDPLRISGECCQEEEVLQSAIAIRDFAEVFRIKLYRALLTFRLDSPKNSVPLFAEAEPYLLHAAGTFFLPLFLVYDALAHAAAYDEAPPAERAGIMGRIRRDLTELEPWVRHAPMNHAHKQALIQAEVARIEHRPWEAFSIYQKAADQAREEGFVHEEALAWELCANFLRGQGLGELAEMHLARARQCYVAWGAEAKVVRLDAQSAARAWSGDDRPHLVAGSPPATTSHTASRSSSQRSGRMLDIASLVKAQQTLSRTVQLGELHAEMIRIVLENAGAERAVLLYRDADSWFVIGRGSIEPARVETGLRIALSDTRDLSQAVANYAIRVGHAVVVSDAAVDPQFAGEAYVRERNVKAVLGLPVWQKGELRLLVYLENNVTAGAFTEDRLEALQLISAQMAISLENALMYDSLENLVARRTAELAEAKNRAEVANSAKTTFLAKMSHELRTPLNGILGYAQLLRQRNTDPTQIDGLNVIQQSGEHLLAMISDLLDLAKTEAGRIDLRPRPLRLRSFLDGVVGLIRCRAEAKALRLESHVPATLPEEVLADEVQLRRVLLNLLGNAIKFTDRGTVMLTTELLSTAKTDQGALSVLVRWTVSDTGPGLDPTHKERVFLPFEQVGPIDRNAEGTGLGLTISQELVRLMGGEIRLVTALGQGSSFSFDLTLPVVSVVADSGVDQEVPSARPSEKAVPLPTDGCADPVVAPPVEDLQKLHELALRGSLYRIMDQAIRLERKDVRYASFSRRLHELAKTFDDKGTLAWIERFLRAARPGSDSAPVPAKDATTSEAPEGVR